MNKLLVITGPTATGKTSLAVFLAKRFFVKGESASGGNGELVSADSRQVYQGMDIGTGKDHPKNIPLHLIDVVKPGDKFSVADYCRLAKKVIGEIWEKGKLPILVGGTGFYIRGLLEGVETAGIKPNWKLREKLGSLKIEELQGRLKELNPPKWKRMNQSDQKNPRRLIRAIEIISAKEKKVPLEPLNCESLFVGLKLPLKDLYQKIDERVEKRLKLGVEKEIKKLLDQGFGWKNSALGSTIGYQEWQPFFEGKTSRQKVVKRWKFAEHAYARRQMTWLRKNRKVNWFEVDKEGWQKEVEKLVKTWYGRNDAAKN